MTGCRGFSAFMRDMAFEENYDRDIVDEHE